MKIVKTIELFYIIYTVYTLFVMSVSNYQFSHAFIGLLFMWITYAAFWLGFNSKKTERNNHKEEKSLCIYNFPLASISKYKTSKLIILCIISWECAILSAKYYTGRNFSSVINGLFGGESAYYTYQHYFANNNLGSFSIKKIPYILMLAFLTIIMIWSTLDILLNEEKLHISRFIYLCLVVLSYLFFGSARGTNFETYIVFIIFAYCFIQKANNGFGTKKIKYLLIVLFLGLILISVYRNRVEDRGIEFSNSICPEIQFDNESLLSETFPGLVNIGLSIFSYLGYGIYCMGVTVNDICFNSTKGLFAFLLPMGSKVLNGSSFEILMKQHINIGARWTPDFIKFIDSTGIIVYVILIVLLGKFAKKILYLNAPKLLVNVISTIIFIEMLSIPIGNFLMTSSSNKLMVVFALSWLFYDKYVVKKQNKMSDEKVVVNE